MINRTRNLKCYCCGKPIHVGSNKTKVHKAKHTFAHTDCYDKRANKSITQELHGFLGWVSFVKKDKLTFGDKIINFILEMVKR